MKREEAEGKEWIIINGTQRKRVNVVKQEKEMASSLTREPSSTSVENRCVTAEESVSSRDGDV